MPQKNIIFKEWNFLPFILIGSFTLLFSNSSHAQGYIDCATMLNDSEGFSNGDVEAKVVNGYTYLMVSPYYDLTTDTRFPIVNGEPSIIEDFTSEIYFAIFDSNCNQIKGTYIGGVGDFGNVFGADLMVDAAGNAHIVGSMYNVTSIPTTDGTTIVDGADPYILHKYAPDGTLLFSTVYGGTIGSVGSGIVSSDGTNTYVTGYINGSIGFPTTDGTTTTGNLNEQYLTKYDGAGNLVYATLIGGTSNELPFAITISNGCAIVVGSTTSTDFPTTDGTTHTGGIDVYITKYDPAGNLVFSTISGGSGTDIFNENTFIETDGTHIYVSSKTASADFPTTDGTTLSGSIDVYVRKYDMAGNLIFSTLFGGIGHDSPSDLVLQGGELYLSGFYNTGDFPVTVGDISSTAGGNFLVKMDSDGNIIYARTYGTVTGGLNGIFVDPSGSVIVPVVGSANGVSFDNEKDSEGLYVAKINPDGTLCSSTFVNKSTGNNDLTCPEMIGDTLYLVSSTYDAGEGNTTDGTNYTENEDFLITKFVFCPEPSPITVDTLSTTLVMVCENGIIDEIEGMKHTIDGSQFPQIFDDGVATTQSDIPLAYQWQVSPTGSAPWTDIPGPLAQQKDYTPAPTTTDLYYRRQTMTAECCGGAIVSTSNVAHIQVSTDMAPMVEVGSISYTCPSNPVMIDATIVGGTSPFIYDWNDGEFDIEDPIVSSTQSTVYTLEVIDANDCIQSGQAIVNIYTANAGDDKDVCEGMGTTIGGTALPGVTIVPVGSPAAGQTSIAYDWSPKDGTLTCVDCPNPLATPTSATDYTLEITIYQADGSSCSTSDMLSVGVFDAPTSDLAVPDMVLCLGEMAELGTLLPPLSATTISTVSQTNSDGGFTATVANLTDGNFETGGRTTDGSGNNIIIDLGSAQSINTIQLGRLGTDGDYRFTVEVSTNGITYTNLGFSIDNFSFGDPALNNTQLTAFNFNTVSARYIRLASNNNYRDAAISEFYATYDYTYSWTPGTYITTGGASATFDAGNLEMPQINPITYTVAANLGTCNFYDQVTVAVIEARAGDDGCGPRTIGEADRTPNINETYTWVKITDPSITTGTGNFTGVTDEDIVPVSASVGGNVGYELTVSYTLNGAMGICRDTVIVSPSCGSNSCDIITDDGDCPSIDNGTPTLIAIPQNNSDSENWTYSWTSNEGMLGLDNYDSQIVMLTDNVTRTYTATITSILDPTYSCSQSIEANSASFSEPTFSAVSPVAICPGTTVNIGDPASNPGLTYAWSNSSSLSDAEISYPEATALTSTDFMVTVTDNVSACKVVDTVSVVVPQRAYAGADIVVCDNGTVTIGSPAITGYTYSWAPAGADWRNGTNENDAQPDVFVATTQTFTLTVTDPSGNCVTTDDLTVLVESLPQTFSLPNLTYCPNQATPLVLGTNDGTSTGINQVPSGYIYSWSPSNVSDIAIQNPTVNTPLPTSSTTYTVQIANPGGCNQTAIQIISPSTAPPMAASDQSICLGEDIVIGDTNNPTGAGISYSWSPTTDLDNATSPNPTFTPSTTGSFTYTITKIEGGCENTNEFTITVVEATAPSLTSYTVCAGESIEIGTTTSGFSYSWSPTTGLDNPFIGNPTFSGTSTTNYTVTVINAAGCIDETNTSVTVNPPPNHIVTIPDAIICDVNTTSTILNASVTPAGNYSYQWSPTIYLDNPNTQTPRFFIPGGGDHDYTLEVTDQTTGCSSTEVTTISYANNAPINLTPSPDIEICAGETVNLAVSATGGTSNYTYNWNNGLGDVSNHTFIPSSSSTQHITTVYTVRVEDDTACDSATEDITVTIKSQPSIVANKSDEHCSQGDGYITLYFSEHANETQIEFSLDGGTTYPYTSQDENSPFIINNLSAGTYELWARFGNGDCPVFVQSLVLNNLEGISLSTNPDQTICITESVIISATASAGTYPYFYTWDNGLGNGQSKTIYPTTTTTYKVTATDNFGCTAVDETTITVLPTTDPACSPCADPADNDGDGICVSDDCDDDDSTIPAPIGTTCDDGNSFTSNDEIQEDGCTCAGEYIPCSTSLEVSIAQPNYNNNGTVSNTSDDTFTVNITISGSGSAWIANGQTGSYGQTVTFGSYPVDATGIIFAVLDQDNPNCQTTVAVNISSCIVSGLCTCCSSE